MKSLITRVLVVLFYVSICSSFGYGQDVNRKDINTIWYQQPAKEWHEALPLGNGRLGAMVYGGIEKETYDLNEETLWSGGPNCYDNPGAAKYIPEFRELVKNQQFKEAAALGDKHMLGIPAFQQAYQALGSLSLEFENHGEYTDYYRSLNMSTGMSRVSYTNNGVKYIRESFASYPDDVIVVRLSCDKAEQLSFKIELSSPHPNMVSIENKDMLVLKGQVPGQEQGNLLAEWNGEGTRFESCIQIADTDGTIVKGDNSISLKNAQYVTLIFTAATAYENYRDVSGDPSAKCSKILKAVTSTSYKVLRKRHINDHRSLFDRVYFEIGDKDVLKIPTDKRIEAVRNGQNDQMLTAQAFQFGRYLLMGSSRPGGQPAQLQGIWNNSTRPPWGSKWTLNINTPMNYWPAESCNLSDCHEPLFSLIEDLRAPGRETAKVHYDCSGFVVHHNTDIWRGTAPVDFYMYGSWPMGAAWLCTHLWEHYTFTQDKAFLEKSYPTMKEAAEFFVDFLIKDENGYWVTCPAISFEQGFKMEDGTTGRVCMGPTMDMQILRALFSSCIESSEILEKDKKFRKQLISMRDNLVPTRVNHETGRLLEWRDDREPDNLKTGQLGHLWGLCPGDEITPWKTPELAAGAEKSFLHREFQLGSWCSGTRLNYTARLHNAGLYESTLKGHMQEKILPNMMSLFNEQMFQIDGNLGMTASVAEALLQSHAGEIHLLPAIPASWPSGSIKGLRARGGFEFDLSWSDGELTDVTIKSDAGNNCVIRYKGYQKSLKTKSGKVYRLNHDLIVKE